MNNGEISDIFQKIAVLLRMKGEEDFKARSFERVAETIIDYPASVEELALSGRTQELEGVGKSLAAEIEAIAGTGKSPRLEELLEEFPISVFELVGIPGVGPKKAAILYRELGISSLEDLERAARGGLLREKKGFGEKSEANIIEGIEIRKKAMENRSIGAALPLAGEIIGHILKLPGFLKISETGTLRRRCETVKEIGFIATSFEPGQIIGAFLGLPFEKEIIEETPASVKIKLSDGLPISIFVVEPDSYGPALVYATGSDAHLHALEERLSKDGYSLKDDGLYGPGGFLVSLESEENFYQRLGISWIPPEIRETGEELRIFEEEGERRLIRRENLRGDLQMHSKHSDGAATIKDMAEKARSLGYSYIAITDHSKSLTIANGLSPERVEAQHREIDALNSDYAGEFKIFKAAEVDILSDGSLDYPDEILKKLDFVLISVHNGMRMPEDQMTERILKAINNPLVHCLAHPTGRLIGRRPEMKINWDRLFEGIKKAGIAVEINAHPSRLDLDEHRCKIAVQMGIPILINTDAHAPAQMDLMEYGIYVARRGWLKDKDVLNTRPTGEIEEFLKSLSKARMQT